MGSIGPHIYIYIYIYIYIFNNHNDVIKYRIRLYVKKVDRIILVRLKKLKSYLVKEKKVEILYDISCIRYGKITHIRRHSSEHHSLNIIKY